MAFYCASSFLYHFQEELKGFFPHLYGLLVNATQAGTDMLPETFIGEAHHPKTGGYGDVPVFQLFNGPQCGEILYRESGIRWLRQFQEVPDGLPSGLYGYIPVIDQGFIQRYMVGRQGGFIALQAVAEDLKMLLAGYMGNTPVALP